MEDFENTADLYIEVTKPSFKLAPNIVSKELHLSDKWSTNRVYRIHPLLAGTYLIFDLHKNPHYQLPTA